MSFFSVARQTALGSTAGERAGARRLAEAHARTTAADRSSLPQRSLAASRRHAVERSPQNGAAFAANSRNRKKADHADAEFVQY